MIPEMRLSGLDQIGLICHHARMTLNAFWPDWPVCSCWTGRDNTEQHGTVLQIPYFAGFEIHTPRLRSGLSLRLGPQKQCEWNRRESKWRTRLWKCLVISLGSYLSNRHPI